MAMGLFFEDPIVFQGLETILREPILIVDETILDSPVTGTGIAAIIPRGAAASATYAPQNVVHFPQPFLARMGKLILPRIKAGSKSPHPRLNVSALDFNVIITGSGSKRLRHQNNSKGETNAHQSNGTFFLFHGNLLVEILGKAGI